ncbi:MAG: proline--tRNA ligase, partial [Candidatus Brocadiales bacterium]|nr:proline--tRNA ligase [Candidatus Bathyanammoxibius sp.]
RIIAALIENSHDKDGIIWPLEIAPYQVLVLPLNVNDEACMNVALRLHDELEAAGVEVLLDDREQRLGAKFKDADLIGIPYKLVLGKKFQEG